MTDQNIPIDSRGVQEIVQKSFDEYGKQKQDIEHKIQTKQEEEVEEQDKNNSRYTKSVQINTDSVSVDEQFEGLKKNLGGFYCELCDDLAPDGLSWLDHLNSEMHNSLLEIKRKDEKVTVLDVQEKQQQIEESTTKIQDQTQEKAKSIEEINRQLEEQLQQEENKGKIQKTVNQFEECNKKE